MVSYSKKGYPHSDSPGSLIFTEDF